MSTLPKTSNSYVTLTGLICISSTASAAAAVAATAVQRRQRPRWQRFWLADNCTGKRLQFNKKTKTKKSQETLEKSMKIDKNLDFGGATQKRISPSNATRKTT